MDLPVLENVTRPIRAGPFSDADLFSIYMMRVFGIDPYTDPPLARTNRPLPAPAFALQAMAERAGRGETLWRRSIRRETVEQAVAAGAPQVRLRAAAIRPARGMRGVPGLRRVIVAQADAIDVPDHRGALRRARPVLAGAVVATRKSRTVALRPRQRVVAVGRVAAAIDDLALFAQCRLLGEIVRRAMQVCDIL